MNWQKFKWKQIVAGFAATLIILFLGNYMWHRTAVERPLIQVLLQDEAVEDAVFHSDGRNSRVEVEVKDVQRFADAARRITDTVKKMQPTTQVIFVDNSNDLLSDLYEEFHFAVFEARANGNFVQMNDSFLNEVQDNGLSAYRLEVDNEAIYVQLHLGDAYLYRVVSLEVTAK